MTEDTDLSNFQIPDGFPPLPTVQAKTSHSIFSVLHLINSRSRNSPSYAKDVALYVVKVDNAVRHEGGLVAQPSKAEDKFPKGKIKIEPVQPEDLPEFCAICYEAFPNVFWDMVEQASRPSLEERIKRMTRHFRPWLSQPGYYAIKAVHADTGEIMGIASWHENGKHHAYLTSYPMIPGHKFPDSFIPCTWRDDLIVPLGLDVKQGLSNEDIKEMYAHHSEKWFAEFEGYDKARLAEMGNQPHWYLAPLCVKKKYWAKGVGKALSMWGIDRADAANPPESCVLEALPNARPVYYHLGFRPTAHHGVGKDTQLVRPAKGA